MAGHSSDLLVKTDSLDFFFAMTSSFDPGRDLLGLLLTFGALAATAIYVVQRAFNADDAAELVVNATR